MSMKYRKLIPFVAVLLTFHQFFVLDVYAYIDPVTGSALLTLLAGVFAAGALILISYWIKIKTRFSGGIPKENHTVTTDKSGFDLEVTELKKFDTIYHLTLEIDDLKFQQYIRSDIEKKIPKIFYSKKIRKQKINKKIKIKKITIFPISRSPIRSMSVEMINAIIQNFCKDYKIYL